jgi:hypothetical protein
MRFAGTGLRSGKDGRGSQGKRSDANWEGARYRPGGGLGRERMSSYMVKEPAAVPAAEEFEKSFAAAIDGLLAEGEVGSKRRKGTTIRSHHDQIMALRVKGWTWEAIADRLGKAGIKVSARTLRIETKAAEAEPKRKRSGQQGRRLTVNSGSAPAQSRPSPVVLPEVGEVADAKPRRTDADFFDLNKVDN